MYTLGHFPCETNVSGKPNNLDDGPPKQIKSTGKIKKSPYFRGQG